MISLLTIISEFKKRIQWFSVNLKFLMSKKSYYRGYQSQETGQFLYRVPVHLKGNTIHSHTHNCKQFRVSRQFNVYVFKMWQNSGVVEEYIIAMMYVW